MGPLKPGSAEPSPIARAAKRLLLPRRLVLPKIPFFNSLSDAFFQNRQ